MAERCTACGGIGFINNRGDGADFACQFCPNGDDIEHDDLLGLGDTQVRMSNGARGSGDPCPAAVKPRPARCPECRREGFLHTTWCKVGMDAVVIGIDPGSPEGDRSVTVRLCPATRQLCNNQCRAVPCALADTLHAAGVPRPDEAGR